MPRKYTSDETPRIGDIVSHFDDVFGAGIITRIELIDYSGVIEIDRIHAYVSGYPQYEGSGQLQIGIEKVKVTLKSLRDNFMVYVDHKDVIHNRAHTP